MDDMMLNDEFKYRHDLNMVLRAMKNRWEITDETKVKIAERAVELIDHHDKRVAIKAIQVLASLEAQKQKDDHKYLDLVSSAAKKEQVTNNSFTQIAVGDLDSVYQLLDKLSPGSSPALENQDTPGENEN